MTWNPITTCALYLASLLAAVLFIGSGCATPSGMLKDYKDRAMQTARDRARFDLPCNDPTATLLSQDVSAPRVGRGDWATGSREAKYTFQVSGCGKNNHVTVYCNEGDNFCRADEAGQPKKTD